MQAAEHARVVSLVAGTMLRLRAPGPDNGQGEPLGRLVACSDVERVARGGEPRSRVGLAAGAGSAPSFVL